MKTIWKTTFAMFAACMIATSALGASIHDIAGTWYSFNDPLVSTLHVSTETASDFAVGSVALGGECWACDNTYANLFHLPMDTFAVLPVVSQHGVAESIELRLIGDAGSA